MKREITYYLSLVLLAFPVSGYAQVTDNFSDGDFTSNPTWSGDNSEWEILIGQLHGIDSIANDTFYLSTPSALSVPAQWEFWVNLKFNTSSLNYVKVFLTSDSADLTKTTNGYYVQIGNTADEISLYEKNGATAAKIIDGADGVTNYSNTIFKIKITRDAANLWTLQRDSTGTGNFYVTEGTVTNSTFSTSAYFGLLVKQSTSGFFGKQYFDDFYVGPIIVDTTPPSIASLNAISQNQLDVYFNEGVDTTTANVETNYSANNGIGNPSSALRDAGIPSLVHLSFATNFPNGIWNTLTVTGVKDFSSNAIISAVDSFYYYVPQMHDVQINEIMADVNPVPVSVPAYEYLELYNRTNFPLNLSGWKLSDATSTVTLPNITILPDSFYVLTSTTAAPFFSGISVAGVASFPTLNDAGDDMVLRDANGNIISFALYDLTWYHDAVKEDGGWSVEQIDPNNPCGGINNWKASVDNSGGTPGRKNSVNASNPDVAAPKLLRATVVAADTIQLFFNEPMNSASLMNISAYTIDNGIGNPISANPVEPDYAGVILSLPSSLAVGPIYIVTVNGTAKDCAGNSIGNSNTAKFAIAQPASVNDVAVNEVLFDPNTNGVEWVEIYNRSNKVIDLKELSLCSQDDAGLLNSINQIAPGGYLIFPQDYFVLSTNGSAIKTQYSTPNPEGFIDMSSIPSLSNDSDRVLIINQTQTIIDKLFYHSDWHLPLLNNTKGISLERINYDNATQDESNWHSAAESVGGATPAYKNSQYTEGDAGNEITISPEVFSPDNDGYNDVLSISYAFDSPGMIGNVQIYDSRGRLEKKLVRNELLATSGTFFWDGITDEKLKARIGIYVVYFEVFDTKGKVKKYKRSCVVGGKL